MGGGCLPRGVSARGGGLPGGEGVCLRGVFTPACTGADIPPWTEFLTHACENITCPRTAKIKEKFAFTLGPIYSRQRRKDQRNI